MSNENKRTNEIDWVEFQKKYLDSLMAFNSASTFGNNNSPENFFWNSVMKHWWKPMKPAAFFENENLFKKVMEQSRNYYFMGEQFSNLIEGLSNFKNKKDVSSFINEKFKELQSMISQTSNQFKWGSFVDACQLPFEGMKNNNSNYIANFINMFDDINPVMKDMRDKLLSIPGIGYSRETQENIQELIRLAAIYQDNFTENQTVMIRLSQDALELMRKEILRMSKKGEEFNSMRQVYDLWVESNEKVYAEYAFTEEYSELNGRLINSQMAFKKLSNKVNEDMLAAMNIPTNRVVNELERRQYEARKKLKAIEAELKNLKEMIAEINTTNKSKFVAVTKKKTNADTVSNHSKSAENKASMKPVVKKKVTKKKVVATVKKKAKKKSRNRN